MKEPVKKKDITVPIESNGPGSGFAGKINGNQNLMTEALEFEIEFDVSISGNPHFFKELEKLGVKFEKVRRYCG